VTSPPYSTNGIADGDTLCNNQATQYHVGGANYRAMLTPSGATAASRFNTAAGTAPWARPDGVLLATTAAGLFTSSLAAAPNVTASGVYIGFSTDDLRLIVGEASGIGEVGNDMENCGNWGLNMMYQTAYGGRSMYSDQRWSNDPSIFTGCIGGNTIHYLCLEQ
jgi:hypothetical protein